MHCQRPREPFLHKREQDSSGAFQTCRLSKSAPALIYRWAAVAGGLEGGCQAVVLLLLVLPLVIPREPILSESMGKPDVKKSRTDRKRSWVMIAENGGYTPLPGEQTLYQSPQRTTLSLQTSHRLPPSEAYSQQCKSGVVYLTNRRVRHLHSSEAASPC